jgi:hypothetical protein
MNTGLDFSAYIAERTQGFTGRQWVLAKIDHWLSRPDAPRFFIITGQPGIGKSALAARLTQTHDLAAYHFCIARRAETIDPLYFVQAVSQQLSRLAGFARGILKQGEIHLRTEQHVQQASDSQVIGVQIERLVVQAPSAAAAFTHTVSAPLQALYGEGFDQQLLLLVDALDEAVQHSGRETIVDLLANAQGLPAKVRFLLTSRPEGAALRHFEEREIPYLSLDAGGKENLADARQYVSQQVTSSGELHARLAGQKIEAEAFTEQVVTASRGNFLYLVWLLRAVADGSQPLDALDDLPQGLDGVYREFLRTRTVGRDIRGPWRGLYRRLLGVLAAAQAKLPATNLAALLADYELLPADREITLVRDVLRLSRHVLASDTRRLAGQLIGRLLALVEHAGIQTLLSQAKAYSAVPWLRPLAASLAQPGGPLERTLTGHASTVNAVAVTPDGRRAISASWDQTLKVWDLATGQVLATFNGESRMTAGCAASDGVTFIAGEVSGRVHILRLAGVEM